MTYFQMLYNGQFDELVRAAFSKDENGKMTMEKDPTAERAYLRMLMARDNIWLLSDETIELLRDEAARGNKYAQYGYARYHVSKQPAENSPWESRRQAIAAMEQGIADAKAMVAITYGYGDIGQVDWEKEEQMLQEAYEQGSELAAMYLLQNYCFGYHFKPATPDDAVFMAQELIQKQTEAGIEPNGWWYYYLGKALESLEESPMRVVENYRKAAELGILKAYVDLILTYAFVDGETLRENDEYLHWIKEGIAHRSSGAFFLDAAREMTRYETDLRPRYDEHEIDYSAVRECTDEIYHQLCESGKLGNLAAFEMLGDMYRYGWYNCAEDYKRALACYSEGTKHYGLGATEKLWEMMHDHLVDRPLDYQDSIALMGARVGSKKLLAETVIAFQEGRLSEYADEIQKYYEPIFDDPDFRLDGDDLPDDDPDPDDDGRYDAWA